MTLSKKNKLKRDKENIWIHLFFILTCTTFIIPFMYVISISVSNEASIEEFGYRLIPMVVDTESYRYIFNNLGQVRSAYLTTAFQAILGTFLSVLIMSLCAYPLSLKYFKLRGPITFIIFFTMLFGGGLIPSYILTTRYLHLNDTIWVYIFPHLVNAFNIIVFRTFFLGLPEALAESAKIDGAGELKIFFSIILPLSKPVLATIALFSLIDKWNDWMTSLIYIRKVELYTLGYLLQRVLREAEFVKQMVENSIIIADDEAYKLPTESMRYALLIIAAGPMLVVFPFFQKYFSRGLTIGSIKG